jgi:hypothetical protein
MFRPGLIVFGLCGSCLIAATAGGQITQEGPDPSLIPSAVMKAEALRRFQEAHPTNGFQYLGPRIEQVYGPPVAYGSTPHNSAEQFRLAYSNIWGIAANDLIPVGPFDDGAHLSPIMYLPETGQYKFTGVYYQQVRDNVPVFRSRIAMMVRNEPNYPLVLVAADLRDIGEFRVTPAALAARSNRGFQAVRKLVDPRTEVTLQQTVIWAGVDEMIAPPVLAETYISQLDLPAEQTFQRFLWVVDKATGAILYQENQVHDVDITGTVQGKATTNHAAWNCSTPAVMNIPYAQVSNGTNTVNANSAGGFTLPNSGSTAVNVTATLRNSAFVVNNQSATGSTSLTMSVTPPGPANFMFNNTPNEQQTALVNTFIHANVIRDLVLAQDPNYPSVSTQTNFPVNVNIASTCNAYYSASTINFYLSGGGCANTGYSSVVHHEFGHNVVEKGGSGQGAYGEGMGDCMAILVSDSPCLGDGFQACGTCLRNATQNCQYQTTGCSSCGSEIHACGVLLSSCVWSVRNNLQATNPLTYRSILNRLTVNSIKMHTGTSITPSITTTFLTLDDDDSDINNGTPHYTEINNGFSAHNMPGPTLSLLAINYPNGRPTYVSPSGGTTMRVTVTPISGQPQPGTARLFVDMGSGFVQNTMNEVSPNVYDAVFPPSPCGTTVKYYVTAQTTSNQTVFSPSTAPATPYTATSASGTSTMFNDNFQTNQGWTVSSTASSGAWQRTTPDSCNRGNPTADADGSGMCYVTQVIAGNCDSDVDNGNTILTSPNMDASQPGIKILTYWRWYDNCDTLNCTQDDPFLVQFSVNGGSTWQTLEQVGPTGAGTTGGWINKSWTLSSVSGFVPTNQFRIRFTAQDTGTGSIVEAGVDGVNLVTLQCASPCPADLDHNGAVNIDDLFALINAWGPCAGCPADLDGNGAVNIDDLFAVINAWGACP